MPRKVKISLKMIPQINSMLENLDELTAAAIWLILRDVSAGHLLGRLDPKSFKIIADKTGSSSGHDCLQQIKNSIAIRL